MDIAIVGWRGMVGSVLIQRMISEGFFAVKGANVRLFSTSQAGQAHPEIEGIENQPLGDANDVQALKHFSMIITCQGSGYSNQVYPKLVEAGWKGYWIDAASAFRQDPDSVIVLDPVNGPLIERALDHGTTKFIGGNCTVSLMMMAMKELFQLDWVQSVNVSTYQAASGAGAGAMVELLAQMASLTSGIDFNASSGLGALELAQQVTAKMNNDLLPNEKFGHALAGNLLPWIDSPMESGQSREEWKAAVEGNKILGHEGIVIPIDGQCVRVGVLRCHSQALTVRLRRPVPLEDVEQAITNSHQWLDWVPNDPESTLKNLTPAAVSGTDRIAVGRLRRLHLGAEFISLFTVGDQLIWGAAEPLLRMAQIILQRS